MMGPSTSNICLVDQKGRIFSVNQAWRQFGIENGLTSGFVVLGANYLTVCHEASGPNSSGAKEFADGLWKVLNGKNNLYEFTYPCHSPSQRRWFLSSVTRLNQAIGGAMILHTQVSLDHAG